MYEFSLSKKSLEGTGCDSKRNDCMPHRSEEDLHLGRNQYSSVELIELTELFKSTEFLKTTELIKLTELIELTEAQERT